MLYPQIIKFPFCKLINGASFIFEIQFSQFFSTYQATKQSLPLGLLKLTNMDQGDGVKSNQQQVNINWLFGINFHFYFPLDSLIV